MQVLENYLLLLIPQRYEFSSKSQLTWGARAAYVVVADTTKVRIFKQITTKNGKMAEKCKLLLIPQRYEFSSKSQRSNWQAGWHRSCCWYHNGTNFQANHNSSWSVVLRCELLLIPQRYEFSSKSQPVIQSTAWMRVVADTTKVRIFKQITTELKDAYAKATLLLIPQRYEFSSKSQQYGKTTKRQHSCCWYHKGTNFQANHNL